jgi:hypothetical protein
MIPFYDNYPQEPDADGWIDIERIYCFDWDAFDKALFDALVARFAKLPEPRSGAKGLAWYSEDEDIKNGYLHASVETPGLQVYGTLPLKTWQEWDRAFQAAAAGLPARDMPAG